MIKLDIALVAACFAVLIPLLTLGIKISNLLRYVEGKLDGLKSEQRLLEHKINASLSLIDYRLRDLERYAEYNSDFTVRYKREENTGAPFLKQD